MIPGPYAICHVSFSDNNSDSPSYRTLRWGYDTAKKAYAELPSVAKAFHIDETDCTVIRQVDVNEADDFVS